MASLLLLKRKRARLHPPQLREEEGGAEGNDHFSALSKREEKEGRGRSPTSVRAGWISK